ncbi:hypothetical protein CPG37_04620 [Malaciobacter canalis]|uniref:Uncharacterized protein n=1 Tax=Malaciobacter canalis TaxID=1912871 RepID=A0ABX4LQU0_9BACT|nr:hypothetical protein [Malaciobacter canalis]PHO10336.1 hypothetical protein CPG37_04620 [Malaciobacter canalis]
MKDLIYSIKAFIGLFLITAIAGVTVAILSENIAYSLYTTATIFILGFVGLVRQSYLHSLQNK